MKSAFHDKSSSSSRFKKRNPCHLGSSLQVKKRKGHNSWLWNLCVLTYLDYEISVFSHGTMTPCVHRPCTQVIHTPEGCKQTAFWLPSEEHFSTCKSSMSVMFNFHLRIRKHILHFQIMKALPWRKHSSFSFWIVVDSTLKTFSCQKGHVDSNPWPKITNSILQSAAFLQVILPWASDHHLK